MEIVLIKCPLYGIAWKMMERLAFKFP